MKLPSNRLIERAAVTLGDELDTLHKVGSQVAGQIVKDTGRLTKRARYKLRNGAALASDIEERVLADVKTRPLAYVLVTFGLACVVGLKIYFDRQRKNLSE